MDLRLKIILLLLALFGLEFQALAKTYSSTARSGKTQAVNSLRAIDPNATGEAKEAIILLPGLNGIGLTDQLYEWKYFWEAWRQQTSLEPNSTKPYSLFVLRYDGWMELNQAASLLETGLEEILIEHPNIERFSFVGYSQGGLIVRQLLTKNPKINSLTRKVLTVAAPHHGTPVLTIPYLSKAIAKEPPPFNALYMSILGDLSRKYKYAIKEQAWDNFDGALVDYSAPAEALALSEPSGLDRFMFYASYKKPVYAKGNPIKRGLFVFSEDLPKLFLERHASMRQLNRWIADPIEEGEDPAWRDSWRLNDGVVPVASALWLKQCEPSELRDAELSCLFPSNDFCLRGGSLNRVFYGLDHLDWRRPRGMGALYADKLHPELDSREIYSWMIFDLLAEQTSESLDPKAKYSL